MTSARGSSMATRREHRTGGLPVYALYNTPQGQDHRHPTREMFAGLDAIVYDVQDLGNRSYTFISTLGYVMDEAAKDNVEVIVLDRPNPLGGVRIEGPRLDPSFPPSFVGLYNIPYVYGLTPAELALWINAKYLERPCHLTIVSMRGWTRSMVWEDTGLRWIATSPNASPPPPRCAPTLRPVALAKSASRAAAAARILSSGARIGLGRRVRSDGAASTRCTFPACTTHSRGAPDATAACSSRSTRTTPGNLTAINFQVIDILSEPRGPSFLLRIRQHQDFDQRDMFDKVCGSLPPACGCRTAHPSSQHCQLVEFGRGALGRGAPALPALRQIWRRTRDKKPSSVIAARR